MKPAVSLLALALAGLVPVAWGGQTTLDVVDTAVGQGNDATTPMHFTVRRSGDLSYPVTVSYATAPDATATHPAAAGRDYEATSGAIQLGAGETEVSIPVSILKAPAAQPDRRLTLSLSNPTADAFLPIRIDVAQGPAAHAVGDFNGDGAADLVVARNSTSDLEILLNTGTAGAVAFDDRSEIALNYHAVDVAAIDVNADGRTDLVALSDSNVAVLLNQTLAPGGPVTFAIPQHTPVTSTSRRMVTADLDRDGLPDIAIGHWQDNPGNVTVLLNKTQPGTSLVTFTSPQNFDTGRDAVGLAALDVDGDGKLDLAVACANYVNPPLAQEPPTVSVLVNTTPAPPSLPAFAPRKDFAADEGAYGLAASDLNGDGRTDLVLGNTFPGKASVLLNSTNGGPPSFAEQPLPGAADVESDTVAIADFNVDGKPDVALQDSGQGNSRVRLVMNRTASASAQLQFAAGPSFPADALYYDLDAADVNGDSKPDLVTSSLFEGLLYVAVNTDPSVSLSPGSGTILATVNPLAFAPASDVALETEVTSGSTTISGISYPAPVAVTGGEYSINDGAFTSAQGSARAGDVIRLKLLSASEYGTDRSATVQIGGVSGTFVATTMAPPAGPTKDSVDLGSTRIGGGPMSPWTLTLLAVLCCMRRRPPG